MIPVTVCLFDRFTIGVSMYSLIVKQTRVKPIYGVFSYKICMEIWMLLFNELNLELICKNPSNENTSCTQHTPFVMSLLVFLCHYFYVVSLTFNSIRF
jgi:hypothetical protein